MFLKLCIGFYMLGCMQSVVNSAANFIEDTTDNVNGKRYYVALDHVNFFQAFIDCQHSGMFLASVTTYEEKKALDNLLLDVPKNGTLGDGFWLSGTNLADPKSTSYYWLSGGEKVVYSNWLPGQPSSSSQSDNNCISWVELGNKVGWNVYACTKPLRYICQTSN